MSEFKKSKVNQHNSLQQIVDQTKLDAKNKLDERLNNQKKENELDELFGYTLYRDQTPKTGFIFQLQPSFIYDHEAKVENEALECYCVTDDGSTFKILHTFQPYFFVRLSNECGATEAEDWISHRFAGLITQFEVIEKEDLDLPNHLSGLKQMYIKLSFRNTADLMSVRRVISRAVTDNKRREASSGAYQTQQTSLISGQQNLKRRQHDKVLESFLDIREYDLPYTQRCQIDTGLRVGLWYDFCGTEGNASCDFVPRPDKVGRPLMKVFAFDIETTKLPLKFPNSEFDSVMMISLMLDGRGLLIVNREIVSQDIHDFDYTPLPEYPGPFRVINCANEFETLTTFFDYIKRTRPLIYVSYNGDFFDWPFIDVRARKYGISLLDTIGVYVDKEEFKGRFSVHLDAFCWVNRDSYLPQGSRGLKAVTKAKLKYNPVELDPEDMLPYAKDKPQVLASYSVSDAVATYYLYMKYIHLFIFSLCVIIPLPPSDVLRKGSGTLCEMLLLVQAFENNVIAPNKQMEQHHKYYNGHLLESETYVGGHVEALESGIFRTDIPINFKLNPERLQSLIDSVDNVLKFAVEIESFASLDDVTNYDEVRDDILAKLNHLRDNPVSDLLPLIYHLDVGAMYPNIILTNRLQPYAMVTDSECAACDYNSEDAVCKRELLWSWRGKYFVAKGHEVNQMRRGLELNYKNVDGQAETFGDLPQDEQAERLKKAVRRYAQTSYGKSTVELVEDRVATTCQREHSFYVDTVRAFRDRRYEYKALNKTWGNKLSAATNALEVATAKDMILLYDSMQLAHKCILNSFYGYVMRKGARWCSMPMAGVVTRTGSTLIQRAFSLVQDVGKTLELDTDGIWCLLPDCFPENYSFKTKSGKKIGISFPCSILNLGVSENFTNHQYHELEDAATRTYRLRSECSIFFEVDGPYRAMVLPASQHEGKNIKKRYAVFNKDGSLAELKGFEIKRRGELQIIKFFQGDVFKTFLKGSDLVDCYRHVGAVGDRWLDVLYSKGADLEDEVVFELISENKNMAHTLESYGDAKSTSITTARRLGEFLGAEMVKDKGLNCHFLIVKQPETAPVSERAVPIAIFEAEESVKKYYLRRWLKDSSLDNFDIRSLIDWEYYITRLSGAIQKIITIPAAFQGVVNPIPRVAHPDWLDRELRIKNDKSKQLKLTQFFSKNPVGVRPQEMLVSASRDMEDFGEEDTRVNGHYARVKQTGSRRDEGAGVDEEIELGDEAVHDIHDNFSDWLVDQKIHWKANYLTKQHRINQHPSFTGSSTSGGVDDGVWQVLSLAESGTDVAMWVLTQSGVEKITVDVPRVMYINARDVAVAEQWGEVAQRVERVLPRGREMQYLFKIEESEAATRANHVALAQLAQDSRIEGIYETDIAMTFNSLLKIGACVLPHGPLNNTMSIGALDLRDSSQYLQLVDTVFDSPSTPSPSSLNIIYIVGVVFQDRHVWVVAGSASSKTFVLTSGATAEKPNIAQLLSSGMGISPDLLPEVVHQHNATPKTLYSNLHKAVVVLRRASKKPSVAVLSANLPEALSRSLSQLCPPSNPAFSDMYSGLSLIHRDVPIVASPPLSFTMPSLQWFSLSLTHIASHCATLPDLLSSYIRLSRTANIPIGNLDSRDVYSNALDVMFARSLRDKGHLLWSSKNGCIEIGGETVTDKIPTPPSNILQKSGCYRNMCVELSMEHLAVNILVNFHQLQEIEHGGALSLSVDAGVQRTGDTATDETFQILCDMVTRMLPRVGEGDGDTSHVFETLLLNVGRWVANSSGSLYDPMLASTVHTVVNKCFLQLYSHLVNLNCQVVYMSDSRLIVSTGRYELDRALSYANYIVNTVNKHPLFRIIYLSPVKAWSGLLFEDASNYAGIVMEESDSSDEETDSEVVAVKTPSLDMQWALVEYLPLIIQNAFFKTITLFMISPFTHQRGLLETAPDAVESATNSDSDKPIITTALANSTEVAASTASYTQELVVSKLQRHLLEFLTHVKSVPLHIYDEVTDSHLPNPALAFPPTPSDPFPSAASHHLVSLELVKVVTHILKLDAHVSKQIAIARENLLTKLNVKSFSNEAQFIRENVVSVNVQVCCESCLGNNTVDLTRRLNHLRVPDPSDASSLSTHFMCAFEDCGSPLSLSLIQKQLLTRVQALVCEYQTQDLVCMKCHSVKQHNVSQYCSCSALYTTSVSPNLLKQNLRVIRNAATYHGLLFVAEIADSAL